MGCGGVTRSATRRARAQRLPGVNWRPRALHQPVCKGLNGSSDGNIFGSVVAVAAAAEGSSVDMCMDGDNFRACPCQDQHATCPSQHDPAVTLVLVTIVVVVVALVVVVILENRLQ